MLLLQLVQQQLRLLQRPCHRLQRNQQQPFRRKSLLPLPSLKHLPARPQLHRWCLQLQS